MPIAFDGQVYKDEFDYVLATNPNIPDSLKAITIRPVVEDRREDAPIDTATWPRPDDVLQLPNVFEVGQGTMVGLDADKDFEPVPFPNPLGNRLGIRALQASTEPAGALESSPGTQTPEKAPEGEIYPSPDYINPQPPTIIPSRPVEERPPAKVMFRTKTGVDITDHDIEDMTNIAMSIGAGTMAGVKSGGIKAKMNELGGAQTLEAAGTHPEVIHQKTGFFRGADGRWRYEIDDSKALFDRQWADNPTPTEKQTGFRVRKLSEIMDHPELYEAYPSLKNTQVMFDMNYKGVAEWNGGNIVLGKKAYNDQGILMHEVQHVIQDIENFAKGGAPNKAVKDYRLKFTKDFEQLEPEMKAMVEKLKDPDAIWTTKEVERRGYLTEVARKYKEYVAGADRQSHEYYSRLAGEVESRNVETRMLMTAEERRKLHPKWTEDVDAAKQIVVDRPVATTAYGYIEPTKGHIIKPK